jgi:spermidine synthase
MQLKKKLPKTVRGTQQQINIEPNKTNTLKTNADLDKPYLREYEGKRALHFAAQSSQSEMSIDMPDALVLGYTRAMMSFLLLEPSPKRIAMIGLGGGSLAKYCYRHLPSTEITVVEINPDVIALRNEFAIPANDARFNVLLGDGAAYVKDTDGQLDALMVDGFDVGGIPVQLSSQSFYDDCFASLANNGILVVNLWGSNERYPEYLERIQKSFSDCVTVVDSDDSFNKIVIAVKTEQFPTTSNVIRHHANLLSLSHPLNFHAKSNKLIDALQMG